MEHLIQPGWYKSAMFDLPHPIRVHCVHQGRVFFTRRGEAGIMCITPLRSFLGLVVLD